MSFPADFDLKERVRSSVDIVDVIGSTLELRPAGRNFVARCPWHNDHRPSMSVNQERQTWKCWPCDIGGDVFSFVMRRDGVDFPTALRLLAEQAGIPIEAFRGGKQTEPGSPEDKPTLLAAMKLISRAYFDELERGTSDDAKIARDYLAERGVDDENRKRFEIGFAPDSWSYAVDLLSRNGFSGAVAEAAGLAIAREGGGHYDRFRGRLMFPIHDLQSRLISLGGRLIPAIAARRGDGDTGAKYINGPETILFHKSQQLYGMNLAREAIRRDGEALVMEGYTDVIAARQAGVEPVVAVLGVALGQQHVKILGRIAQQVVLVLDGDAAGQRRADEVLELFIRADVNLRVLTLPDGSDPADYLATHGRDAFNQLVNQAPDALEHKLLRLTNGVDLTRDTHQVSTAIDSLLGVVAKAPRGAGLKIDQMMLRMSRTFGLSTDRLRERLDQLRQRSSRRGPSPPGSIVGADPNAAFAESAEHDAPAAPGAPNHSHHAEITLQPLSGIDRELFEVLIESPELAGMAVESIDPNWLQSNTAKMLLSAYQDLDLAARDLDIASLLLIIENEPLKNQLVSLEERVRQREGKTNDRLEDRYAAVMTRYREREYSAEKTRQIAKLESAELADEEADALLKDLFDAERARHGTRTD